MNERYVCTADRPDGWCHSTTNNHHEQFITVNIYRFVDGVLEHHHLNGKRWSYAKARDKMRAIDAIYATTRRTGLLAGSLVPYEG